MEKIEHVSDTALMVAACRAIESERPDALVRDPFAARLAGHKGMGIARNESGIEWMCLGIGLRSRAIDELVTQAVRHKQIQTVVNLGAGLDTRPWRLELPVDLRWIEVDFTEILDYKAEQLADVRPHCKLERLVADLSRETDRGRVFDAVGYERALMITEGLLMYLPRQAVRALSAESRAKSGVVRWIFDVSSLELMRRSHGDMLRNIDNVRAEDHLNGREVLEAALGGGWTVAEWRSYVQGATKLPQERLTKLMSSGPRPDPPPPDDPSGVYLLERSAP